MAPPASPALVAAAGGKKMQVRSPSSRPAAAPVTLDTSGDGRVDTVAYDTTGDGRHDTLVPLPKPGAAPVSMDTSGDGRIDTVAYDTSGDGRHDTLVPLPKGIGNLKEARHRPPAIDTSLDSDPSSQLGSPTGVAAGARARGEEPGDLGRVNELEAKARNLR